METELSRMTAGSGSGVRDELKEIASTAAKNWEAAASRIQRYEALLKEVTDLNL